MAGHEVVEEGAQPQVDEACAHGVAVRARSDCAPAEGRRGIPGDVSVLPINGSQFVFCSSASETGPVAATMQTRTFENLGFPKVEQPRAYVTSPTTLRDIS